jgi:hypothetical protein
MPFHPQLIRGDFFARTNVLPYTSLSMPIFSISQVSESTLEKSAGFSGVLGKRTAMKIASSSPLFINISSEWRQKPHRLELYLPPRIPSL